MMLSFSNVQVLVFIIVKTRGLSIQFVLTQNREAVLLVVPYHFHNIKQLGIQKLFDVRALKWQKLIDAFLAVL